MDLTRAPYALTTALFVLATACDGKHSAINEYDCFASSNGCPIGFECETNSDGRALCVDRSGNSAARPDRPSPPPPIRDGIDRPNPNPESPVHADFCPDGSERQILLLGQSGRLVKYTPGTDQFEYLTTVDCRDVLPDEMNRPWKPFSMAVDSHGTAWISYFQAPNPPRGAGNQSESEPMRGALVYYTPETGDCSLSSLGVRSDKWAVNGMTFASGAVRPGYERLFLYPVGQAERTPQANVEMGVLQNGQVSKQDLEGEFLTIGHLSRGDEHTLWLMTPEATDDTPTTLRLTRLDADTFDEVEGHVIDVGPYAYLTATQRQGALHIFSSPYATQLDYALEEVFQPEAGGCSAGQEEFAGACLTPCEDNSDCGRFEECSSTEFGPIQNACIGWGQSLIHTFDESTGALTAIDPVRAPITVVGAGPLGCP